MGSLGGLREAECASHREPDLTGFRTLRKEALGEGWVESKGQSYRPPHQVRQLLGPMCRNMENQAPDGLPAAAHEGLLTVEYYSARKNESHTTGSGF